MIKFKNPIKVNVYNNRNNKQEYQEYLTLLNMPSSVNNLQVQYKTKYNYLLTLYNVIIKFNLIK